MNLTELLEDLTESTPQPAVAPAEIWAAGLRRRRTRRVRTIVAAVAAVGVLLLILPAVSVPVTPTFARSSSSGVDGHPARIGRQWVVRDLPEEPGPVAALLSMASDAGSRWHAVRADGHRWELPEVYVGAGHAPTLSPDGRLLGFLTGPQGPYAVRDLVDGRTTSFDGIGDNSGLNRQRYSLQSQVPSHWSPDGRHLLLSAFRVGTEVRPLRLLLDVRTGAVDEITADLGQPAGWASADRLVFVSNARPADPAAGHVSVVETDLIGRVLRRAPLLPELDTLSPVDQWAPLVHGDGVLALVSDEQTVNGVRRFFRSGTEFSSAVPVVRAAACGASWGPAQLGPSVPVLRGDGTLAAEEALAEGTRTTTVVWAGLQPSCLVWASKALAGPARGGGLLGTRTEAPLWWWRELLLGALVLTGLGGLVARVRARRRRLRVMAGDVDWFGAG